MQTFRDWEEGGKKTRKKLKRYRSREKRSQLSGSRVCQIPPVDETPEVTLDLGTKKSIHGVTTPYSKDER